MNRALVLVMLLSAGCVHPLSGREIPAFPGAEGFGSTTPGGRGGKVLLVTNLNDAGPGSLRAACNAEGPRIIVFRISGLIHLKSPIVVEHPFLTLAGQSAPGDGVCLRNYALGVATHDVVVRYLRCRTGDEGGPQEDCLDLNHGARRVVLDHCSASWSIDEALSLAGNVADVTVQWCLIAEALDESKHQKGSHGCGSLVRANGPVSLHHNLWAHNRSRNPRLGDNYNRPPYPTFDFRNNVIYDYGEACSGVTQGRFKANYVGNFIRPGPSSRARFPISVSGPSDMSFFIRDNVFDGNEAFTADNNRFFNQVEIDGKRQVQIVAEPVEAAIVTTLPAREAYEAVLAAVGATLPARDPVDARIVNEVRQRKGSIINSQEQVGGWPEYRTATPPPDSDNDAMPDAWESQHKLNPQDSADGALDRDGDGYTNVEEYLNSLAAAQGGSAVKSGTP